jgi:hypothetical protein
MNAIPRRLAMRCCNRLLQPWAAATLFIAWYLWQSPLQGQDDSRQLYIGCRHLLDWFQGRLQAVGHVRPYPLFQYLSGVAVLWAGQHGIPVNIVALWATCSALSLAGIVIVFHCVAMRMRRPAAGWVAMVLMLGGPLLMYANCTFNELVAAFLILCFTAAVSGTAKPLVCASLFWASGITKETAPVLLAVIWLGELWIRRSQLPRRGRTAHGTALLAALVITSATNTGFNLVRYGVVWNQEYLQPGSLVSSWLWRMQYCAALWISPNGGVAAFWPSLIGIAAFALRDRQSAAPATLIAIVLGMLTVGLSAWWQPFGWESWGPRLMLPWLPACLLILQRGYPDATARFIDRCVRTPRRLAITSIVVCVIAVPHIMATANPRVVGPFFAGDWRFPHGVDPANQQDEYGQNVYFAWQKVPPLLLRPVLYDVTLSQVAKTLFFLTTLMILLCKCRQSSDGSNNPGRPALALK